MKNGFTLAEVLITLGIIGVVAAITIPGLITENQKRVTVTRLEKALAVINQAYKQSFDDVGEPPSAFDIGAEEYFKQYWEPYIKVLSYCDGYAKCGYTSNTPYYYPNGTIRTSVFYAAKSRTAFLSMDGVVYLIFAAEWDGSGGFNKSSHMIWVDINGPDRPNRFGRDVFVFQRVDDGGGIQPWGYKLSDSQVSAKCLKNSDGFTCAEKIRRAGWRIDKSYPWK